MMEKFKIFIQKIMIFSNKKLERTTLVTLYLLIVSGVAIVSYKFYEMAHQNGFQDFVLWSVVSFFLACLIFLNAMIKDATPFGAFQNFLLFSAASLAIYGLLEAKFDCHKVKSNENKLEKRIEGLEESVFDFHNKYRMQLQKNVDMSMQIDELNRSQKSIKTNLSKFLSKVYKENNISKKGVKDVQHNK